MSGLQGRMKKASKHNAEVMKHARGTSALVPEACVRMILVKPFSFSVISTDPGIPA